MLAKIESPLLMTSAAYHDLEQRFGERNAMIMRDRYNQRFYELNLMEVVGLDWHDRMWQTPDVAMCVGRYRTRKQRVRHNGR